MYASIRCIELPSLYIIKSGQPTAIEPCELTSQLSIDIRRRMLTAQPSDLLRTLHNKSESTNLAQNVT